MLTWVCAMRCEAKPLIDFYRLQKSSDRSLPFDYYSQGDIHCIVSGIGRDNMARTLKMAQKSLPLGENEHWINLGIGGHQSLPVGSARMITHAADAQQLENIELSQLSGHTIKPASCISLDRESSIYPETAIVDMEAHHFAKHCLASSRITSFHSIKVISDNATTPPTRDKARISTLIADNMPKITDFARRLQESSP